MYLQEKQELSRNRNDSLTGEILYKGQCYVERIPQEGHRAPWHRRTGSSDVAASSSRRPKNTQHCQAGPLSTSALAWFTAIHPFDLSSNILAWGDRVSFSAPSTRPFSLRLLGLIPMTWSFYRLWSCPSRHTHIIACIFVRLLVSCLPRSLDDKLHKDRAHI